MLPYTYRCPACCREFDEVREVALRDVPAVCGACAGLAPRRFLTCHLMSPCEGWAVELSRRDFLPTPKPEKTHWTVPRIAYKDGGR